MKDIIRPFIGSNTIKSLSKVLSDASMEDLTFIHANTKRATVPTLPRMNIRLVDTARDMFRYTEEDIQHSRLQGFPPFWAFMWPGGYGLTRYIIENSNLITSAHTTVFDFGCGCGSAALAAHAGGADTIIANDIDPLSILATAINFKEQGAIGKCNVFGSTDNFLILPAGDLNDLVRQYESCTEKYSMTISPRRILLVGDMLYDEDIGPLALKLVENLVDLGWCILIGDPGRDFAKRHFDNIDYGTIVAEYELPPHIKAENNGLNSVRVRKL